MKAKEKTKAKETKEKGMVLRKAQDIVAQGAKMLGLTLKVDPDYYLPAVDRRHVLWMKFVSRSGKVSITPYVLHTGLVDILEQRGYKSVHCESLEPRECVKMGHYNAGPNDWCQRAACTIILKNGKTMRMEANACRHNVPEGAASAKRHAEVAETRAIDRCVRRLCNVSMVAVTELEGLRGAQEVRAGDKVLDSGGVREVIEADFRVDFGGGGKDAVNDAIERGSKAKVHRLSPSESIEWNAVNRKLHQGLSDVDIPVRGFHAYIRGVYAKKGESYESLSQMAASELQKVYDKFWGADKAWLDAVRKWCEDWEKKNPGVAA